MKLDWVLSELSRFLTFHTLIHTLIQGASIQTQIYFNHLYLSNSNDSYLWKGCATDWKTILNQQCLSVLASEGLEGRQSI